MDIQIASDLHLDYNTHHSNLVGIPIDVGADTLVMAGDLCEQPRLLDYLDEICRMYTTVIYVAGNHDFYGSSFPETLLTLQEAQHKFPELHVLDNQRKEINGRWFTGSTLWFRPDPLNDRYRSQLSDFHVIQNFEPRVYEENGKALNFLRNYVRPEDIVVTHHMPHPKCVAPVFKRSSLNRFFLCDARDIINDATPDLWICGHTHSQMDFRSGRTRILCNAFGYHSHKEDAYYNPSLVLEV